MSQSSGEGSRPSAEKWKFPRKGAGRDTKKRRRTSARQEVESPKPKRSKLPTKAAPGGGGHRDQSSESGL